jgi:heme A synthase
MNQFKELQPMPGRGIQEEDIEDQVLRSSNEGTALRRLALVLLVLMLVVTSASAWLRLAAQPRAACADWPSCRSGVAASVTLAEPTAAARAATASVRLVHRVAATAALLGIVAALVMLWRRPREARDAVALRGVWVLLALALALSALGVATPGARSVAVLLGNLLGGLMMVAAAAHLWMHLHVKKVSLSRGPVALPLPLVRQARALIALWLVQMALGALSGAAVLHLAPPLHLLLAMGALPWALALGTWAWRSGHARAGGGVLAAVFLQLALGIWALTAAAGAVAVLAHNLGAALSVAALAAISASPVQR